MTGMPAQTSEPTDLLALVAEADAFLAGTDIAPRRALDLRAALRLHRPVLARRLSRRWP